MKVTWSAAQSALGYFVLVQSGSSSAIAGSAVTTGRSVTIGGLQPGSDYQVLVVSENYAGSDPAATVLFSTKK